MFDRRSAATLKDSLVRLYPKNSNEKVAVSYADIAALAFTGRDTAAGQELGSLDEEIRREKSRRRKGPQPAPRGARLTRQKVARTTIAEYLPTTLESFVIPQRSIIARGICFSRTRKF